MKTAPKRPIITITNIAKTNIQENGVCIRVYAETIPTYPKTVASAIYPKVYTVTLITTLP